jgi:fatty-acyl-CoA synthase
MTMKEAAVVAAQHLKWQERPLAAVLKEACQVPAEELRSFFACQFAKWQLPDEFIVPGLPLLEWQAAEI